jgi:uroporphyrinogen decarboxylase
MHYQPRDRAPICDFGFWPETLALWHEQGLPAGITDDDPASEYFGMDSYGYGSRPRPNIYLCPTFEHRIVEDRGDHEVVQQGDGVRVLRKKFMGSIPHHESHLLVDRQSWKEHYLPRLDPTTVERYPADWDAAVKLWRDTANRTVPFSLHCGSLYGRLRDWMGMENLAMVVYDDPAWFEEMVTTLADLTVAALGRMFEAGAVIDAGEFWEDMCYNSGPLLSPEHFKKYLVPQYQRITGLLRKYGVDVFWLDCDGKIDALLPLWLEGGVNCMFPMEIGTWGTDPIRYRKEYGKELLMMGGFDKHILARSKAEIEAEVRRLTPLVEEGGFIGFCDHRVPPDVPMDNYLFYLKTVRRLWGHDIALKPLPSPI